MFVRLIFVVVSLRRKFFHAELFPNYGMQEYSEETLANFTKKLVDIAITNDSIPLATLYCMNVR